MLYVMSDVRDIASSVAALTNEALTDKGSSSQQKIPHFPGYWKILFEVI